MGATDAAGTGTGRDPSVSTACVKAAQELLRWASDSVHPIVLNKTAGKASDTNSNRFRCRAFELLEPQRIVALQHQSGIQKAFGGCRVFCRGPIIPLLGKAPKEYTIESDDVACGIRLKLSLLSLVSVKPQERTTMF